MIHFEDLFLFIVIHLERGVMRIMKIKKWMDCIGDTPIVELCHIEENEHSLAHIYAKIEAKSRKTDPFMALVASMVVEPSLGAGIPVTAPKFGAIVL